LPALLSYILQYYLTLIYIASQNQGERPGWDRIEGRIVKLLDFIRAAKENAARRGYLCMGTLKNRCFHQPGESKLLIINVRR